jgi:hypothetical protein
MFEFVDSQKTLMFAALKLILENQNQETVSIVQKCVNDKMIDRLDAQIKFINTPDEREV